MISQLYFVEDYTLLEILQIDQVELMKNLNLQIPQKLKRGDIIDGYELTLSLIQNDRSTQKNDRSRFTPRNLFLVQLSIF